VPVSEQVNEWDSRRILAPMKRLLVAALGLYLLAAVVTRAREAAGMKRCDCLESCWCKKPGLGLFRWVTPRTRHHLSGDRVQ
jgi:hypothetical protein